MGGTRRWNISARLLQGSSCLTWRLIIGALSVGQTEEVEELLMAMVERDAYYLGFTIGSQSDGKLSSAAFEVVKLQ